MVKKLITEISEEDFRKLDLTVHRTERVENSDGSHKFVLMPKKLNEILDEQILYTLKSGYASDLMDLQTAVTVAIHEPATEAEYQEAIELYKGLTPEKARELVDTQHTYLDKFMNRFTGAQDFQIGWGIKHLYSTRDYYEAHEDYWRVSKKETKVIYRITLDKKWADQFVLKHKTEVEPWPYDFLPGDDVDPDYVKAELHINYELEGEKYIERGRTANFYYTYRQDIIPVDKDGHRVEPAWKKDVKSVN